MAGPVAMKGLSKRRASTFSVTSLRQAATKGSPGLRNIMKLLVIAPFHMNIMACGARRSRLFSGARHWRSAST